MAKLAERIVFATDFSKCSEYAFQHAMFWAESCESALDIIHVIELHPGLDMEAAVGKIYLDEHRKTSRPKLQNLVKAAKARVKVASSHELVGLSFDQINHFAADCRADLLVMGTHGWTGLNRVLLGSTAERASRGAPCPVLTVRYGEEHDPATDQPGASQATHSEPEELGLAFKPQRILVPIDFSDFSLEAFEYAVLVSKHFQAATTLLHVLEPHPYGIDFTLIHSAKEKQERESAETRLLELAAVLNSNGIPTQHQTQSGIQADSILEVASEHDLIIMGTHGRRGFSRFVIGSVAEAVLRRAPCLVLTVKSPRFQHIRQGVAAGDAAESEKAFHH